MRYAKFGEVAHLSWVAAGLLLLGGCLTGCARWYTPAATPLEVLRREPSRVRIETTGTQEWILDNPRVVGDSVLGSPVLGTGAPDSTSTVSVPLDRISAISIWVGPPDTGVSLVYMGIGVIAVTTPLLLYLTAGND